MKRQVLISDIDRYNWDERVNDHMKQGWIAVPGTLACVCSSVAGSNDSSIYSSIETKSFFAIVLEKEITE